MHVVIYSKLFATRDQELSWLHSLRVHEVEAVLYLSGDNRDCILRQGLKVWYDIFGVEELAVLCGKDTNETLSTSSGDREKRSSFHLINDDRLEHEWW